MATTIHAVDLDGEQETLLALFERNLLDVAHRRRYDWLYRRNPGGLAWCWAVVDEQKRIVGAASVFPRRMWIGGRTLLWGQVGDFAIDQSHRSLGPAIQLQRATFEPVDRGLLGACYDCPPHARGMATFRRLGLSASCRARRYVELLRVDGLLRRRFGAGPVAAGGKWLGNRALALRRRMRRQTGTVDVEPQEGAFGAEFSTLDERIAKDDVIRRRRSADELNWRFREDPLNSYLVLVARRRGELLGAAVCLMGAQDASLVDLWAINLDDVGPELLRAMAERLARTPIETVQAVATNRAMTDLLERSGYRYRSEAASIVVYAGGDGGSRGLLDQESAWWLTHADVMA